MYKSRCYFYKFLQKKFPHQYFYSSIFLHLISLCYFEKVIAIYQSFPLVEHSAHAKAIFRGFASSKEKSSRSRYEKMTHCASHLYADFPCLHCGRSHRHQKRKHAFFSLRARFKRILLESPLQHDSMASFKLSLSHFTSFQKETLFSKYFKIYKREKILLKKARFISTLSIFHNSNTIYDDRYIKNV